MRDGALEPRARARFVVQGVAGVGGAEQRLDALGVAGVLARGDGVEAAQRDGGATGLRVGLRALERHRRRAGARAGATTASVDSTSVRGAWHDAASMSKIDLSLKDAFRRARDRVESYGVRVYIGDVQDPNTGIFDGSEIGIDYANDLEMSLFVLVHLFGHTVQWNTVPAYRTIDTRVKPGAPPDVIEEARAVRGERLALRPAAPARGRHRRSRPVDQRLARERLEVPVDLLRDRRAPAVGRLSLDGKRAPPAVGHPAVHAASLSHALRVLTDVARD